MVSGGAENAPLLAVVLKTGGICVSLKGLASGLPMDAPVLRVNIHLAETVSMAV